MIISKDLAALLVTAKSAPDIRKMLFSNRHFFLEKEKRTTLTDCKQLMVNKSFSHSFILPLAILQRYHIGRVIV